jgi:hypothetical protein
MTVPPCTTNPRLYDTALDNNTPPGPRTQAIHQAAALCATCPTPCELKVTGDDLPAMPDCKSPSYGGYLAHKKRGENACKACKAKKREYDNERYAKNPRRARAPQRAYEARQRAVRAAAA